MRLKKPLSIALITLLSASLLAGCVGRFPVTNKLLQWNRGVTSERWVHEGLFLVLNFVPVYGVAVLTDLLVMNAAEFWTGERVLVQQQRIDGADGEYALATYRADDSFDIEAVAADGSQHRLNVARDGNNLLLRNEQGQVLARLDDALNTH